MADDRYAELPWLDELMIEVRQELKKLKDRQPDETPGLEFERDELEKKLKGWNQSLGDPELPRQLRIALQKNWDDAETRRQAIDQLLAADAFRSSREEFVLDPVDVLERVHRLADVLATHNPTITNMELAKHIDRIECFSTGKVIMKTNKLGLAPEAAELLAEADQRGDEESGLTSAAPYSTDRASKNGSRRRTRLRVTEGEDDNKSDLGASIEFATDTFRFAGLGEKWFWTDEFQVPTKGYWIDLHHEKVKSKYAELERETGKKPSLKQLARHFGISAQWIRRALDFDVDEAGRAATDRRHRGGYTPPISLETKHEIVRRYEQGEAEKHIARSVKVSRGSVTKALDEWDEQRGEKRPDGRSRRQA